MTALLSYVRIVRWGLCEQALIANAKNTVFTEKIMCFIVTSEGLMIKDYSKIIDDLGLTPKMAFQAFPEYPLQNWRDTFKAVKKKELTETRIEKLEMLIVAFKQ